MKNLLKKGQIIGNSESVLLQKLNITPFSFEIKIKQIFDCNCIYDTTLLDIKPEKIAETIQHKIHELDLISIAAEYPTVYYLKNSTEKTIAYLYYLAKLYNYEIKNQENQNELPPKTIVENEKILEIQIEDKSNIIIQNEKEISEDMGLNFFD
jgi:large subunit ribosomal protein LP0